MNVMPAATWTFVEKATLAGLWYTAVASLTSPTTAPPIALPRADAS